MRSPTAPEHEGTSTRARIRAAAIERFAREGFSVGVRAIADDAGVSAASVMKVFGSKEALRAACDGYVFRTVREAKQEVLAEPGAPGAFLAQLARVEEYRPLVGYVLRSIQDGGPHAAEFVEHMIADALEYIAEGVAAGTIVPSRDEEARARYLMGAVFGALMLEQLRPGASAHRSADPSDTMLRAIERITLPALELMSEGFLTDRSMLDAYLEYVPDPPADGGDAV
ncbi:TetR/AcrR family transcriptional regulator [Agromyces sp. SYSU T00194]|uniref:TetR/AcrR family transcriptional regulator n=1 Tax=Agromyces chitinivorans TaxID=3158560 RepID=UPI003399D7DE